MDDGDDDKRWQLISLKENDCSDNDDEESDEDGEDDYKVDDEG